MNKTLTALIAAASVFAFGAAQAADAAKPAHKAEAKTEMKAAPAADMKAAPAAEAKAAPAADMKAAEAKPAKAVKHAKKDKKADAAK